MAYVDLRYFGRSILQCPDDDELCVVRHYETEVIIVPVLLLAASCLVGGCILWLVCRRKSEERSSPPTGPLERGWDDPPTSHHDIVLSETSPGGAPCLTDPALSQWQIPRERILGGLRKIAQGTYGHIYQARLASDDPGKEQAVVLKELHESADPSEVKEFLARIKFHAFLGKHKNLVEMLGCCTDRAPLYLVMESMNRDNLLEFLWMCRKDVINMGETPYDLTERQVYNVAQQVASGLNFLHQKGLIHGDVAARNVLLQDDFTAKLGGLQIPFDIQRSGIIKPHTSVPIKWQSPERIMKKPLTPKTDLWSFGVLLFEMITLGSPPYADLSPNDVLPYLQRGHRMPQPATCKAPLYSLMKQCWQWKYSSRPNIADLRKRLHNNFKAASDKVVLRVPDQIEPEAYAIVAGTYGTNRPRDYTIL